MLVARGVGLAVACVAVLPTLAYAQAGFRAGFALESGKWQYGRGLSLEGSYTVRGSERLGVRFDVALQTFMGSVRVNNFLYPCRSPGCPPPPPSYGRELTVVSSTAGLVLTEQVGSRSSFYGITGVGAYVVNDMPIGHYTRLGLNAGGGFRFGENIVAEVRYHGLFDPRGSRAFIPITVGFRF